MVEQRLAFSSAAGWVRELKGGLLDAVLLPMAGMVGPSEPPEPPALAAVAALNPSLGDPEVVAIAVASSSLPFLVAGHHLGPYASAAGSSGTAPRVAVPRAAMPRVTVLLPPARHQPLLHSELIRQALLPLRCCSNIDPAVWIELLQRERLLLPAPRSLLAHCPWREAGLTTLPPADPLWEVLWLLVAQERRGADWVAALVAGVRERVLVGLGGVMEKGDSRPLGVAAGFPPAECPLPY